MSLLTICKMFPGSFIGGYYLCSIIASGTQGQVFRAFKNERFVALKVFLDSDAAAKEIAALRHISTLNLPFFPTVIEISESPPFVVTELLDSYIPLSALSCKRTVSTIITALIPIIEQMNNHGITHGDLHQNNVLVNPVDYTIKIIDFGSSKLFSNRFPTLDYDHFFDNFSPYFPDLFSNFLQKCGGYRRQLQI